jgi:catechol 2,3-dioxygenase-like lactoylglutathione lyase family enzyme
MPTLDTFRKQAKQLQRWHRERNYSIAGRIRGLPRYRDLTDVQALKLKFPLSEAQEIIALEAGFESWAALKAAVADESPKPRTSSTDLAVKAAIPMIYVSSVPNAATFFRDKLGFSIEFLHGNPAFYGCVSRNGVPLHLRFVHEPVISQEVREKESLLSVFIAVENVKALFDEYKANDVPFVWTLRKEPWGGPTFAVRDLDGNWIGFSAA